MVNWAMGRRFMQRFIRGLVFGLVLGLLVSPSPLLAAETPQALAPHAMVVAANPLAVEAGLGVLRRGGSAVDAAVAVQAVLSLVEPQSSGLGGGAFMVFYNAI
jgi:gamma-glutamyltranspeptidase/glutathione hydrolase